MLILEILACVVVTVVLSPFMAYVVSYFDILWTRLPTGSMKFIDRGESFHRIIYDVPGFELDENNVFVANPDGKNKRKRNWLARKLGIYWIGLPPFHSIHKFTILKETENPSGKKMADWVIRKGEVEVSELRFLIPRAYAFANIELGDKDPVAIDVLDVSKFEVVDPIKMVYGLKGAFFQNASGILEAATGDILNKFTLNEFMDAPKGEVDGILSPLKDPDGPFNEALVRQVGLRLVGTAMRYDPANEAVREAMESKTIARERADARRIEAEGEKDARIYLAQADKAEVTAVYEGSGNNSETVKEILKARAIAGKDSKITVYVDGAGAVPALPLPTGGDKK